MSPSSAPSPAAAVVYLQLGTRCIPLGGCATAGTIQPDRRLHAKATGKGCGASSAPRSSQSIPNNTTNPAAGQAEFS